MTRPPTHRVGRPGRRPVLFPLHRPKRDGRWNELAKDVAAMANTRGGLIVFGVRDTTCELVRIDPDGANIEQYAQWIRNHVRRRRPQRPGRRPEPSQHRHPHPDGPTARPGPQHPELSRSLDHAPAGLRRDPRHHRGHHSAPTKSPTPHDRGPPRRDR
ncbi:ATP-binding protein [Streptomyces sp. NPDC006967]|uniref:AlbA family DNA-binding domain-containing protein n=1 Tax=unclassified Streptomyces TaxID=2593676 RepID=UPI00340C6C6B